jgi:hypothetical protein
VKTSPSGEGPIVVVGKVSVQVRATDLESGIVSFRFEVKGSPSRTHV